MIIGITGGIGVGKSEVVSEFKKKGIETIDVDRLGHRLLERNDIRRKIIKKFGKRILSKDFKIDRKKLGRIVFKDEKKLKEFNSIIHPPLLKELKKRIKKSGDKDLVVDCALIFEWNIENLFDKIILVIAPDEKRRKNLNIKGMTLDEIDRRIKSQLRDDVKKDKVDFVITNDGTIDNLRIKTGKVIRSCIGKHFFTFAKKRKRLTKYIIERKIIHIITAVIPLSYYFLNTKADILKFIIPLTLLAIVIDTLRLYIKFISRPFDHIFGPLLWKSEKKSLTGATHYLISACIACAVFPKEIAILSLLFLSFSDTIAFFVGQSFGRIRIFGKKSIEGCLAGLVSSLIIILFFPGLPIHLRIIGAVLSSIIEILPWGVDDNLTIPLITGLVLTIILNYKSLLEVFG
jgi:dephospho-CoA kinase